MRTRCLRTGILFVACHVSRINRELLAPTDTVGKRGCRCGALGRLAHCEALKVEVRAVTLEQLPRPREVLAGAVVAAALRNVGEAHETETCIDRAALALAPV